MLVTFYCAAFCWISLFGIPQCSELCFCWLAVWQWQWYVVLKSALCHLAGMLHYIDVTETEKWSRRRNDSIAVVPQYVFSLWLTMTGRWSDRIEEEKGERIRRWQKDGCGFTLQTLHGYCRGKMCFDDWNASVKVRAGVLWLSHFIDNYII